MNFHQLQLIQAYITKTRRQIKYPLNHLEFIFYYIVFFSNFPLFKIKHYLTCENFYCKDSFYFVRGAG